MTIQARKAAEWTALNPVLHHGQPGFEEDTGKLKIGDGHTAWADLIYTAVPPGIALDTLTASVVAATQLAVAEGTNKRMGVAVLVAGSKVVATTAVAANSRIYLTSQADGGTPGWLRVSARTAGTSFTITSSDGADTSTVAWLIVDPA